MDRWLLLHSGLAEACVTGQALLEGAAVGTSLSLPYCRYLVSTLLEAVVTASDKIIDQPQKNIFTVFAETWHAASLAHLSDADIANAWRLVDYLMLDAACVRCLEDVTVQRQARSGVANQLITAPIRNVIKRLSFLTALLSVPVVTPLAIARGVDVPDAHRLFETALWGRRITSAVGSSCNDGCATRRPPAPYSATAGGWVSLGQHSRSCV
jgi:hypothetical protein